MMEDTVDTPAAVKYRWRILGFSKRKDEEKLYSEAFVAGGCKWRIFMYPKGNAEGRDHYLSIFLDVVDADKLPSGWSRNAEYMFKLIDDDSGVALMTKKSSALDRFKEGTRCWGYRKFMPLTELHDHSKGYVVNDTVVVEAVVTVHKVVPAVELASQISSLTSYFSNVSVHLGVRDNLALGNASDTRTLDLVSSDDIEKAKHSLKLCLSDLFKLNMSDRLLSALSVLSRAQDGLSPEQRRSIEIFQANFDDFVCDFLTFEQDNSNFELQKNARNLMHSALKKNHETHLSYERSWDTITKEKDELIRKLKEVKQRETRLVSDWEILMNESEDVKLTLAVQEKKLAEAEEKKRIAEERMPRSTGAWSSLKEQFL